jgi:hypothetical protein
VLESGWSLLLPSYSVMSLFLSALSDVPFPLLLFISRLVKGQIEFQVNVKIGPTPCPRIIEKFSWTPLSVDVIVWRARVKTKDRAALQTFFLAPQPFGASYELNSGRNEGAVIVKDLAAIPEGKAILGRGR